MRYIKNKFGDVIFCIRDDGTITDKFDCDVIGHLKGDRITDRFDVDTLYKIRQDGTITDKYDCDIIGHIREDGNITDKYDVNIQGRVDTPVSTTGSSDSSCLSGIVALVFMGIIKLIKGCFLYIYIPCFLISGTILQFLLTLLFFATQSKALGWITIYCIIMHILSIPYLVILFIQKRKRKMSWGETFKYYGKWFLKGPLAYKDIIALKNS